MSNPWKLTPRECAALDALVESGCRKIAARILGCDSRAIGEPDGPSKKEDGAFSTQCRPCWMWDRHTRAESADNLGGAS